MKKEKPEDILTPSQLKALKYLNSDYNVFITGGGGVGKSFLINYYKKHHGRKTPVVSSTGAAAVLVNGRTLHSFFSLGTMTEDFHIIIERIYDNDKTFNRLVKLTEIIIDEVSMISGKTLNMIDEIMKTVKDNQLPFGGVRVICVGDFYQIPPIEKISGKPDYCFISQSWRNAKFIPIELKEFRRQDDREFLSVLNNIRIGICTDHDDKYIKAHTLKPNEEFEGTRIFGKKDKVNEYNMKKLEEIDSPAKEFITEFKGDHKSIEKLRRNLPIEDVIRLKLGALVMIRVNDHKNNEYVNGTMGKIVAMNNEYVLVKKIADGEVVRINKYTLELKDADQNVIASAKNIMISIAYAITVFKSQGSSIDRCIIDFTQTWGGEQVYVSLSRLKSPEGLRVVGWRRDRVGAEPLVKRFYAYIDHIRSKIDKQELD